MFALLGHQVPPAQDFTCRPATDVWAEGLAAHAVGDWAQAESRLVGALLSPAAENGGTDETRLVCTIHGRDPAVSRVILKNFPPPRSGQSRPEWGGGAIAGH